MKDRSEWIGNLLKCFGGGLFAMAGVMVLFHLGLGLAFGGDYQKRAAFGDQFGPVNALVAGASLLGLIISITIQSRDLRAQTEALKLQQEALQLQITEFKEQKEEMRRSAEAQAKTAEAQEAANEIALAQLMFDRKKLRIETAVSFAENSTNSEQRRKLLEAARNEAVALEKDPALGGLLGKLKVG